METEEKTETLYCSETIVKKKEENIYLYSIKYSFSCTRVELFFFHLMSLYIFYLQDALIPHLKVSPPFVSIVNFVRNYPLESSLHMFTNILISGK